VVTPPGPAPILDDIRAEAERVARAAVDSGLPVRLMGGLAIWVSSPTVRREPFARPYADMDFAAASRGGRSAVGGFFEAQGYAPERYFNALHGAQRLNYLAPDGRWTIDVVFDELNMSHRIDLRGRLSGPRPTIDLADLLLTKLQVWEINRKDLGDIACLLADHPLAGTARGERGAAADGPEPIDVDRIRALAGADWGLCHTVERNLRQVRDTWRETRVDGATYAVAEQAEALLHAIEAGPKTLSWKARARIGERVRWYETPEEVRHQPDAAQ